MDGNEESALLERGRLLFAQSCEFEAAAAIASELPPSGLPEVAFAGRSNVGKSSLVNALTRRKGLARTSRTPGRTRMIIFFNLGSRLRLVDLPGYGYARAGKADMTRWAEAIQFYLENRPTLSRVELLIDARRGLMATDIQAMDFLDGAAAPYQVVLTKCDKLKKGELEGCKERIQNQIARRPAATGAIHATSAAKGIGIPELRAQLSTLAEPQRLP